MHYGNIREEELKKKVAQDYFSNFDAIPIIGNIDFAITERKDFFGERYYYLWAEAKRGKSNIYHSLVQLILTIGKARTFDSHTPPLFLGAFDAECIAFISYSQILDIFYQNDFNWNVRPSDHTTKEFQQVLETVTKTLEKHIFLFAYHSDDKEIKNFIQENFKQGKSQVNQLRINKSNFISIYNKWVDKVAPSIAIIWEDVKPEIIMADFYLADLLSRDNYSIKDKLNVVLKHKTYELNKTRKSNGVFSLDTVTFRDGQKAYNEFWQIYERPPRHECWDYIINRRDLLVPQDVRSRKGSYFTPRIWVEKSQEYLALEFGEDWQDHYYIWDCAAGTGNLLVGLSNKYHIWASTLDVADVKVMHERIQNGANLLKEHVFQFDFLNDSFDDPKLPESLRRIINDPEERKKLIIYINPPYAEAASAKTVTNTGKNKKNVALNSVIHDKYIKTFEKAINELFAQFLIRIYHELPLCKIAEFSKLKTLQASNFQKFRTNFRAKLGRIFIIPADSFDNVKGDFPIGFKIWHTEKQETFSQIEADVFTKDKIKNEAIFLGTKTISSSQSVINSWYREHYDKQGRCIGIMNTRGNDFQNQKYIRITSLDNKNHTNSITINNIIQSCIYFSVRWGAKSTWLNDRDQFLYPNDAWQEDAEFQSDCLAFTLFHNQNRITRKEGINHWIPFREEEVNAPERFESHWMTDYIQGKLHPKAKELEEGVEASEDIFEQKASEGDKPIKFSQEAQAVFEAGRALWSYYMSQADAYANASLYDIRAYFQGFSPNKQGKPKMNSKSEDETYTRLITSLRERVQSLAEKIQPKVYAYGFLKE